MLNGEGWVREKLNPDSSIKRLLQFLWQKVMSGMIAAEMNRNLNLRKGREFN